MIIVRGRHSSSLVLNNYDPTESDFTLTSATVDRVLSGESSGQSTVDDRLIDNYTAIVINHEATCTSTDFVSYESSNEAIATVDPISGYVTRVANGTVGIIARGKKISKRVNVAVSQTASGSTSVFNSFVAGSLARHMADQVDDRLEGKTAETSLPIYTIQNFTTNTYQRNTDGWLYDVNLTSISPWNSESANKRAGILISPRHILTAYHYYINPTSRIRFVTATNTTVTRTVTALTYIPGTDIAVEVLNSDVPGTVSFAKVLPANWRDYLPSISLSTTSALAPHPILITDQEEKALIHEWCYSIDQGEINFLTSDVYGTGITPNRLPWHENIVSGDSGSPACAIINDELVLVGTILGVSGGPLIAEYITEINSAMTSLGGGYQLTVADLSGFTSYA